MNLNGILNSVENMKKNKLIRSLIIIRSGFHNKDKFLLAIYFLLWPFRRFFLKNMKLFGKVIIKNPDGIFYCGNDFSAVACAQYSWEKEARPFFEKIKEGIFIDIGANIGYFTNLCASICKEGKVIAFEPIEKIYKQNLESIKKNKFNNIELFKLACGSENKVSEIYISGGCIGSSTLLNYRNDIIRTEKVEIKKLDEIFKDVKRIDLIKIDIEGFESEALTGAINLLKKFHPKIIFEAWDEEYLKKIESVITPLGYKIKVLDGINYSAY